MRWIPMLLALMLAGCTGPYATDPLTPPTDGEDPAPSTVDAAARPIDAEGPQAAALAALGTLDTQDCTAIEYEVLGEEAGDAVLPDNMSLVLDNGRLIIQGITAECMIDGETGRFTLAGALVDVTGPFAADATHLLLVHVAVDAPTMLDALADWGLFVPDQRAWSLRQHDGADARSFIEADTPEDNVQNAPSEGPSGLVARSYELSRNNHISVARGAAADAPARTLRLYEATSDEGDDMQVNMVVDIDVPARSGPSGEAHVRNAGIGITDLAGTGRIVDGLDLSFTGRAS